MIAYRLAFLLAIPCALSAQDSVLTRLLTEHRLPVRIAGERLADSGGRLLVAEGKAARHFLVGEEHGVAELPDVVRALLTELRPHGYDTFAIEVSPLQGARLDSFTRLGAGMRPALDTLLSAWYSTVPFYSVAEERELLAAAMAPAAGTVPMRIWGLDYEISADRYYLRELERLVRPDGRAAVRAATQLADTGFALMRSGNPSRGFVWSAPDSVFGALRDALGTSPSPRAREIVDVLARSARINRAFLAGDVYASNLDRSAYLRENFARELAAARGRAEDPRVLLKFGWAHTMRGWTYTHTLDVGTAAAIDAEGRGERSFHLLIVGAQESRTARMNIMRLQYAPTGRAALAGDDLAWLRPAVADSGWQLFDMRPVRAAYLRRRNRPLTPSQDRHLLAFDAILVLAGSRPGTPQPLEVR